MALYKAQSFVSGKFVDKKKIMELGVQWAKIMTETSPEPSQWKDDDGNVKIQDICKVKFSGMGEEQYRFPLNKIVINGLVDAFGEDSKKWIGQTLRVETEKTRVGGKAGIAVYLIPDGYEKIDDEEGYAKIVKKGFAKQIQSNDIPVINEDDVKVEDIPW